MLDKLHLLNSYPYYFQFTLNAYGKDLEAGIPSKNDVIIPTFQNLSQQIDPERIIWRYDPIILTPKYTTEYHIHYFEELAKRLSGHTQKCVISFVNQYRHLGKQFTPLGESEIYELAGRFSDIARKYNLMLETCAEAIDLSRFGIGHGHCIDGELFERIIGQPLSLAKDKNQREECGCMSSIDIGMYDSCLNGCKYCYANHSATAVQKNFKLHDPSSPLLYGTIGPEDVVKDRAVESYKIHQMHLF